MSLTGDDGARQKAIRLASILQEMGAVVVAFSGGVDSSYLLSAALDALGAGRVMAVTADSPLLPERERATAEQVAALLGATHLLVPFDELVVPEIAMNDVRRCYYCKRARFQALLDLVAKERTGWVLVHGENADDHLDYRPGEAAARELGVRAPLAEAGLTKADIRALSRLRGLSTWDHPAASCLAARFPYDTALSLEGLHRVDRAEQAVQDVTGIDQVRVRDHFPAARLEVPAGDLARVAADPLRGRLLGAVKAAGYRRVWLDLDGYRMGSMNDGVVAKQPSE